MAKSEFCMLAHTVNQEQLWKYTGWFMSRKLRGHRCLWDGGYSIGKKAGDIPWSTDRHTELMCTGLWTRRGKVINAPTLWVDQLPRELVLDGELWMNDDEAFIKSVTGQGVGGRVDDRWKYVTYQVFNIPHGRFPLKVDDGITFFLPNYASVNYLSSLKENWVLKIVPHARANSVSEMLLFYDNIISAGGEGIMLLNPNSYYECCRSNNLLKMKPEFETEALVVNVESGTEGKQHENRIGKLVCTLVWDEKVLGFTGGSESMIRRKVYFKVGGGLSNEEREYDSGYWVGKLINFKFLYISADGIPISPNFVKVV
jgi:DNA ligase-1